MRIVDAEGLKEIICDITNYAIEHNQTKATIQKRLILAIETLPPVPNVRDDTSEWIMRGGRIRCKKCDSLAPILTDWEDGCTVYKYTRTQYCPNCGAKMKGVIK
jgi:hypothetical protein